MMTTREDTLDIIPNDFMRFVKNGRVIQGTWKKKENHKIYADWLGKQLGYETREDWYKITKNNFKDNHGSGLLTSYYNNTPSKFIQNVFTEIKWLPWKFKYTVRGYWDNKENHKIYAVWLEKQLGYETREDWYKITVKDFQDNQGDTLLKSKYSHSPLIFLKYVFHDTEWLPWKFTSACNNYWDDKENHKMYADWLGKQLGYETREDWYKITTKDIFKHHGSGLMHKYNDSTQELLKSVYSDTEWLPWKFTSACNNYWDDKENHKMYADWLGKQLGYETREDWYKITQKTICKHHGGGFLNEKYNGSPQELLKSVYPDTEWLPWKFRHSGNCFWNDKENHVKYANFIMSKFNFKTMEDWYKTNRKLLKDNHGGSLLFTYYKGSMKLFATTIYPDYPWDLSKFKKNYSQGEIEWLICLSIEKYPDIRHALNEEGQYLIPNSLYHADGYSKTKHTIFEYNGDYYHGNPESYNQEELFNKRTKITYGERYQKTLEKQRFCEENGYNYVSIWESEWVRFKNSIIQLQRIFKEKQEANF